MKYLSLIILSLTLLGCEGTTTASDPDTGGGSGLKFTSAELDKKFLFSEELQQSNVQDGFILRFENTANLEEIGFVLSSNNNALSGKYNWVISNDKIQVTYPSNVVCSTTKTEDNNSSFETTSSCTGGSPRNAKIEGTLIRPLSFNSTNLDDKEITIELNDNKQEVIKFNNDGIAFTITEKDNGQAATPEDGTFKQSIYTNVVRLNYTADSQYSLLVLLDGNLSSGSLLDLRYGSNDDALKRVRIYKINANNVWEIDEVFDTITNEST